MKPEDAIKKWCPFARVSHVYQMPTAPPDYDYTKAARIPVVINRGEWDRITNAGSLVTGTKCIADMCMAWRNVLGDTNDGHCGLAGFQPHGG